MAFNPGLNRVTLAHLPGLPPDMGGTLAHEWLASWGIAQRMQAEVDGAGLPPIPTFTKLDILKRSARRVQSLRLSGQELHAQKVRAWSAYPVGLAARLEQGDPQAAAFAQTLGVALAALVATLHLAPPDSRAARAEWPAEQWARWQAVRQIVLGGGVLSGALGPHLYSTARDWLPRLGASGVTLHLFPKPRELMLRGAAQHFSSGPVVILDAGHTAIKRAYAEMAAGEVVALYPAPLCPTPYEVRGGQALLERLTRHFVETVPAGLPVTQFALSLSAHLTPAGEVDAQAGRSSFYGALIGLPLADALQARLTRMLGRPCTVQVMHEGQAAASGMPSMDAAVLLGTSVGGAVRPAPKG